MKRKIKIFASVFAICSLLSLNNVNASDALYGNYRFSRGVGNMYYYVDSSASSYTSYINSAINNWVDTGYGWNPIYLNPVSSSYATSMDFYLLTQAQAVTRYGAARVKTTLADTTYYLTDTTQISMNSQNWFYTEIKLNSYALGIVADMGSEYRTGEIKHEIGHALGLYDQNNNVNSIMCGLLSAGRIMQNVDQTSHNAINAMYN